MNENDTLAVVNALEINNFSYTYTNEWTRKKICAVEDLSIRVKPGEFIGFIGHNGSGKTTTIKAILGFINSKKEQIKIFGKNPKSEKARDLIGFVAEKPYFYRSLTVKESLRLYGTLSGVSSKNLDRNITRILDRVNFNAHPKARISTLSKGMLQKVSLAQAIIHSPKLLILDEPFSGLDPMGRKEFREILIDLNSTGCTVVLSSHILADVEMLCSRVIFMSSGKLVNEIKLDHTDNSINSHFEVVISKTEQIDSSISSMAESVLMKDRETVLRFEDMEVANRALKEVFDRGITIRKYNPVVKSLEEVFVDSLKKSK